MICINIKHFELSLTLKRDTIVMIISVKFGINPRMYKNLNTFNKYLHQIPNIGFMFQTLSTKW